MVQAAVSPLKTTFDEDNLPFATISMNVRKTPKFYRLFFKEWEGKKRSMASRSKDTLVLEENAYRGRSIFFIAKSQVR